MRERIKIMVNVRGFNFYFTGYDNNDNEYYGEFGVETDDFNRAKKEAIEEADNFMTINNCVFLEVFHALNGELISTFEYC